MVLALAARLMASCMQMLNTDPLSTSGAGGEWPAVAPKVALLQRKQSQLGFSKSRGLLPKVMWMATCSAGYFISLLLWIS